MNRSSLNIQILINCVYACGNLFNDYVAITQLKKTAYTQVEEIYGFHEGVLSAIHGFFMQYPTYDDCLGLLLWFMRNTVLLLLSPHSSLQLVSN